MKKADLMLVLCSWLFVFGLMSAIIAGAFR